MTALELRPDPGSAAAARAFVRSELSVACPPDLVATVLLLTSELVTNAILHARTELLVTVQHDGSGVRVAVTDQSPLPPVLRNYGNDASTGRGMQLVDRLAQRWGVEARDGDGKTVWFEVAPEPAAGTHDG